MRRGEPATQKKKKEERSRRKSSECLLANPRKVKCALIPAVRQSVVSLFYFLCCVCVGVLLRDVVFQSSYVSCASLPPQSPSPSLHPQCGSPASPPPHLPPHLLTSSVPPPTRQANGCHGCGEDVHGYARGVMEIKVSQVTRLPNPSLRGTNTSERIVNKNSVGGRGEGGGGRRSVWYGCKNVTVVVWLTNLLSLSLLSSDLQQQSSQESKDVVSTVNLPLASRARRRNVSARRRRLDLID